MTRIHIHGDFVSKNPTILNFDNTGGAIRIANLEGPILGLGGPDEPQLKAGPSLSSDPAAFDFLDETSDQWVFTLANNHAMDYGWDALQRTIEFLTNKGAKVLGAGESQEISRRPLHLKLGEEDLVIISCTHRGNGESSGAQPGVAVAGPWVEQAIMTGSSSGQKIMVVIHGGTEDHVVPNPGLRSPMMTWTKLGADVCVASQSHVPQILESTQFGLLIHGLGNLVADPVFWSRHNPVGLYSREVVLGESLALIGSKFTEFDLDPSDGKVHVREAGSSGLLERMQTLLKELESVVLDSDRYWSLWQSYSLDFFKRFARRQMYISLALFMLLPITRLFNRNFKRLQRPYLFDLIGWDQNRDLLLESLALKYRIVVDRRSPQGEQLLRRILQLGHEKKQES